MWGGGGHWSIPSFRHSGRSDKNQCVGGGTGASLHSDTVEDLIRISVEGQVWEMLMLERVWSAGLAEAKDQEGQTTGVGHVTAMEDSP